jgi:hypothetical protein
MIIRIVENWEKPNWDYRDHPESYHSPRNFPKPIQEKDATKKNIKIRIRKRDETRYF